MESKHITKSTKAIRSFISSKIAQLRERIMYGCRMIWKASNGNYSENDALTLYGRLTGISNPIRNKNMLNRMDNAVNSDPEYVAGDLFPDVDQIYSFYKKYWDEDEYPELLEYKICPICACKIEGNPKRNAYNYNRKHGRIKDPARSKKEFIKNVVETCENARKLKDGNHVIQEIFDKDGNEKGCYVCSL
jgi:hypothetical protein